MSRELEELLRLAREHVMSEDEIREQRRSFVYGNTHIENPRITRDMVAEIDAEIERGETSSG